MELIICTDERGGMAFNKRRISKDTEIINRVEQIAKGNDIYILPRSESLFEEYGITNYVVCDDIQVPKEAHILFLEFSDLKFERPEVIYHFNFNRHYPSDVRTDITFRNYDLLSQEDFAGSSHENITLSVYKLRG